MALTSIAPGDVIFVQEAHYQYGLGALTLRVTHASPEPKDGWWYVQGWVIYDGREVRQRFASVSIAHVRLLRRVNDASHRPD